MTNFALGFQKSHLTCVAVFLFVSSISNAHSANKSPDVVPVKQITLELAIDIAQKAVKACRDSGYQVSAVVVDRAAVPQAILRDVFASRYTIDIAQRKANAVILSGTSTSEFRQNRADIRNELNLVDGILILDGALPIRSSGALIGAIGVSGAPGGDKDEACAKKAIASVEERLEFAD